MGEILNYSCTNCSKIKGKVFYGSGRPWSLPPFLKELDSSRPDDYRLFGCEACGIVFDENINQKKILCPQCKKETPELILYPDENDDIEDSELETEEKFEAKYEEITEAKCPNCKVGNLKIRWDGLWD